MPSNQPCARPERRRERTPEIALRENWKLAAPDLDLDKAQLTALVEPAFPGQSVTASAQTEGGLANANLRLQLSQRESPLLLRLFMRDPREGAKEFALNQRLFAHLPVPRFLHFSASNPFTGHPYALVEWVEGTRLELAAGTLDRDSLATVARSVGGVLANIHAITFPRTGFFDETLRVTEPIDVGCAGLVYYLRECLVDGLGEGRIGSDLTRAVIAFAEREGRVLDAWDGPPCLTHADFGGSNILVRDEGTGWTVAAVLDWEFAFSGSPFFDFSNLLRPPLGGQPGFREGVVAGYIGRGGRLPPDWWRLSRLAGLLAWADFLNRPAATPALIADARAMIIDTMAEFAATPAIDQA